MLREKHGKQGGLFYLFPLTSNPAKFIRSATVARLTKIHGLSSGEGNMRENM